MSDDQQKPPAKKDIVTKTAEAPAKLLETAIETTQDIGRRLEDNQPIRKSRDYWHTLGPGLTTGASDDDPSGIATYSQTGAQYGFQLLWLAAYTFPLMAVVQEMCARIGLVTGRGLAGNIRMHFSRKVLYTSTLLLFAANTFNIGADIGAMAQGTRLLFPGLGVTALVIGFTALMLGLQIFTPYVRYARYLKWLAMVLFAYILAALLGHLDWATVFRYSLVPNIGFNKTQLILICAILGTTITPYLFFWQTSQEVEDEIAQGETTVSLREGATRQEIRSMRIDVWSGMFLSNLVMFFIIAACAGILFPKGITNITTAAQAAQALRPFAGNATYFLFAIGIIGVGMLAIPVMAGSSAYAMAESFHWREGLSFKLKQAYAFYGVIIFSMLIGLGMNFIGLNPIKALIYSAVANGMVAPVTLCLIVILSSNKKVMGDQVNGRWTKIIGWTATGLMAIAAVAAILSF